MVAVMCMLWVANMVLACTEWNAFSTGNALASCVLTVCLIGTLV